MTHPYRLIARHTWHGYVLSEWHSSLQSALEALQEHQQRWWTSVAVVPVIEAERPAEPQLPLFAGATL